MYVIQHDMGIKWSIYLTNLYQFLFDDVKRTIKQEEYEFEKTENTLVFTVDVD